MANLYPNPTNWVDDSEPDINAANLNNIEQGIDRIASAVISQIINDPDKIASMAALFSVSQRVDQLNSDMAGKANASDITAINAALNNYSRLTALRNNWETNGLSYWRRVGNEVHLHIQARNGITTNGTIIVSGLPAAIGVAFSYSAIQGSTNGLVQVDTNGTVTISGFAVATINVDLFYICT